MEGLVKRYFWVVTLVGLAVVAWLVAGLLNGVVGMMLARQTGTSIDADALAAATREDGLLRRLSTVRTTSESGGRMAERSPFFLAPIEPPYDGPTCEPGVNCPEGCDDGKCPPVEPGEGDGEGGEGDGDTPVTDTSLQATTLPIKLYGTMVVQPARFSSATVDANNEMKVVHVGAELLNGQAEVYGVQRTALILKEGSKLTVARLWPEGGEKAAGGAGNTTNVTTAAPAARAVRRAGAKPGGDKVDGVEKLSNSSYRLKRDMLNKRLENVASLGKQVRVVPNYKGGKYEGFRMIGMNNSSMFRDIGFNNGDVVKVINGNRIDSPNKALALYEALKTKSRLTVQIERNGILKTMRYLVQ